MLLRWKNPDGSSPSLVRGKAHHCRDTFIMDLHPHHRYWRHTDFGSKKSSDSGVVIVFFRILGLRLLSFSHVGLSLLN